jgi:hypothetical protein
MSVSSGAMARTNADIRRIPVPQPDLGRERVRHAIFLADQLLDELEQLMLRHRPAVPDGVRHLGRAAQAAALRAGVQEPILRLSAEIPVVMDDVYELEDRLLHRARLRALSSHRRPAVA